MIEIMVDTDAIDAGLDELGMMVRVAGPSRVRYRLDGDVEPRDLLVDPFPLVNETARLARVEEETRQVLRALESAADGPGGRPVVDALAVIKALREAVG